MKKNIFGYLLIGLPVVLAASNLRAQSTDALLKKLVEKKLLTQQEADELKKETTADFDKAYRAKTGLPEWVTGLKFFGDVRGRYDLISFEDDTKGLPNTERQRYRVRARVGLTATFLDNLEMGFRFTTSDSDSASSATLGQGGNSISGNTTFQNNATRKNAFFDQAYGKWSPIKNDNWTLSLTIGKMESPFTFSEVVLDADYMPEGGAVQLAYKLNDIHSFKLAGGYFIIDEVNQGANASSDPTLVGAQLRWDAKWNKNWESSMGLAAFSLSNTENLGNGAVPNTNVGNSRNGGTNSNAGLLVNNYNPLIADASVTYWFESAPLYKGRFPVRAVGTLMHNPSADQANNGWEAGITFGKAGKKGTWELNYRYRSLESDAIYEELPDDDFGAFYAGGLTGSGKGAGYGAGTNVRGHQVKASYSPFDAWTLSVTYYRTELIDAKPKGSESEVGRVLVDAMWKF